MKSNFFNYLQTQNCLKNVQNILKSHNSKIWGKSSEAFKKNFFFVTQLVVAPTFLKASLLKTKRPSSHFFIFIIHKTTFFHEHLTFILLFSKRTQGTRRCLEISIFIRWVTGWFRSMVGRRHSEVSGAKSYSSISTSRASKSAFEIGKMSCFYSFSL